MKRIGRVGQFCAQVDWVKSDRKTNKEGSRRAMAFILNLSDCHLGCGLDESNCASCPYFNRMRNYEKLQCTAFSIRPSVFN
jgi:hypothetical protein